MGHQRTKKFITRKVIVVAILEVAFFGSLWALSMHFSPFPRAKVRMRYLLNHASEIEAIASGSTFAVDLDFKSMGLRGFYMWTGICDITEMAWQIKTIVPKLPHLKYVFFPLRFDHFYMNFGDRALEWQIYYTHFPDARPIDDDWSNYWKAVIFSPLIRWDHWAQALDFSRIELRSILNGGGENYVLQQFGLQSDGSLVERFPSPITEENIRGTLAKDIPVRVDNVKNTTEVVPEMPDLNLHEIDEMADLLKSRGVTLVIFYPPRFSLENELIPQNIRDANGKLISKLLARHPEVLFFDFSRDEEISNHAEYFGDPYYLKPEGSKLFSAQLKKKLKID